MKAFHITHISVIYFVVALIFSCTQLGFAINYEYQINLIVPDSIKDYAVKTLDIAREQLQLGQYCDQNSSYDCILHHEHVLKRFYSDVTFKIVTNDSDVENSVGVVGAFSSTDSIEFSNTVATPRKLPMVSYCSTAIELSDKEKHRYFSRVVASNDIQANSMMDHCYRFNWKNNIAIIGSEGAYGESGVDSLRQYAALYGIEIDYEGIISPANVTDVLQEAKALGCKYILSFVSDAMTKDLLHSANILQMLNGDFLFVLSENAVDALNFKEDKVSFLNGTTADDDLLRGILLLKATAGFWRSDIYLKHRWRQEFPGIDFPQIVPYIYDSFLSIVYAIDKLLEKTGNPSSVANGDLLIEELNSQKILGSTGYIFFNQETGDRLSAPYILINVDQALKVSQITRWEVGREFEVLATSVFAPNGKVVPLIIDSSFVEIIGRNLQFYPVPDSASPPPPRFGSTFTLAQQQSSLIVFGGRTHIGRRFNDFWFYDMKVSLWRQIFSFRTPAARSEHVAFTWMDTSGEYFYSIFGGYNGIAVLQEHWNYEFTINSWTEYEHAVVPQPRLRSRVVNYNDTIYLVGGEGILSAYNDMWSFSHGSGIWNPIAVNNPMDFPPRYDHCLCATYNALFVWAGRSSSNSSGMNDIHIFDLHTKTWQEIFAEDTPIVRYAPLCAGHNNLIYLGLGYSYHPDAPTRPYDDFYKFRLDPSDGIYRFIAIQNPTPSSWQGRDHLDALMFNDYLIGFAGWGPNSILNDLFRLSFNSDTVEIVHNSVITPPNVHNFEYATIGNSLFVFGGNELKSSITYTNDFFKLDLDTLKWSSLTPGGTLPPPSSGHATVVVSDILMIHGGITTTGFMNNMWMYPVLENTWLEVEFDPYVVQPSARAYHTADLITSSVGNQKIYFFGGLMRERMLHDVWEFGLDDYVFREVAVKSNGEYPTSLIHLQSAPYHNKILLYCGEDTAVTPNKYIYSFDPIHEQYDIFAEVPMQYQTSRCRMIASDGTVYIHGGSFFDEISDLLLQVKDGVVREIDISQSAITPERRSDHSLVLYGNRLLLFGGIGAVPSKKVQSDITIYNNLFEYRLGPVCLDGIVTGRCFLCSPGTYHERNRCKSCPKGYYSEGFGSTKCLPCPSGFYGAMKGAASFKLCFPCPPNTWQDEEGSAECKPCNSETDYCPIGSTKKLSSEIGQLQNNVFKSYSEQPHDWPDNSNQVDYSVKISLIVSCSLIALILIFFTCGFLWLRRCIFMLDLLFNEKHNYRIGEMKRKKTNAGGILSILFFCIWVAIVFNIIFPYIVNNTRDDKALTPTLSQFGLIDYLIVSLNFTGPPVLKCTMDSVTDTWTSCEPSLNLGEQNIFYRSRNLKCKMVRSGENTPYCHIRSVYYNFGVDTTVASITMHINEPSAFSSYFGWNVSSASAYPLDKNLKQSISDENGISPVVFSRAEGSKYSSQEYLFKGKKTPTKMSFKYIPTIFTNTVNVQKSGALIESSQFVTGSQVDSTSFTSQNGFVFSFVLEVGESILNINRISKKSTLSLLYEIGGATSGLLSAFVLLLRCYEQGQSLIINSRFIKRNKYIQRWLQFNRVRDRLEILDRVKAKKEKEKKLAEKKQKKLRHRKNMDLGKNLFVLQDEEEMVDIEEQFLNDEDDWDSNNRTDSKNELFL